ncbi:MAG: class I SAM-dependent methyltransferase [Promethearchaeota archaeon]|jgi:tRNA (cmo5U34)-methyltransferase
MNEFKRSNWYNGDYSRKYLDEADFYIPERDILLRILASFYRKFITSNKKKRILDLGCGNGILSKTLFNHNSNLEIVVTDGSKEMLIEAKKEFDGIPVLEFCQITFEEIIQGKFKKGLFDLIISSFAIHHLNMTQKMKLFNRVFEMMNLGSYFINIDVVVSDYENYNDWYYDLWKEWIIINQKSLNINKSFEQVPEEARRKSENHFDLLGEQLDGLKLIGFSDVECHYKYGVFAIYGGKK